MDQLKLKNKTLAVNLTGIKLKNPVMNASGAFGLSYGRLIDLKKLGAIVTKTVTLESRDGNPLPRIIETPAGMLNSIGLQNPGIEKFLSDDLVKYQKIGIPIFVSVAGKTLNEYIEITKKVSEADIAAIELNVSCPNVKAGGLAFGADLKVLDKVVSNCRKVAKKPLIVKLTPNVQDIGVFAKTAENAGADIISLVNTFLAMSIDINKKIPVFANTFAGLSGPAIKPIALRMVYQVARSVSIPIIGLGGIRTAEDAIEFLLAGADAIAVGTSNFIDPNSMIKIIAGIKKYLENYKD